MNIFVPSHYEVLGVSPDTPVADIKRAYQRLALECHPDKVQGSGITPIYAFERVLLAWHVLGDDAEKTAYDKDQTMYISKSQRSHYVIKLEDCDFHEEEEYFSVLCRCSGDLRIENTAFESVDTVYIECPVCSLQYCVEM